MVESYAGLFKCVGAFWGIFRQKLNHLKSQYDWKILLTSRQLKP